jgi:hypothetical protein
MLGGVMLSGCYTYVRTDMDTLSPGDNVRFLVTTRGAAEYVEATGAREAPPRISGTLDRQEPLTAFLRVPQPPVNLGSPNARFLDQMVGIPSGEILEAELRVLSRPRTALMVGGAATVGTLLVIQIMNTLGDGSDGDGGDLIDLTILAVPIG